MDSSKQGVMEVDPPTLSVWLEQDEAVLVDVREPDEHARERLAGATLLPLSKFDPSEIARAGDSRRRLVLHCKGGRRSLEAANRFAKATGREVFSLHGGLDAWKAAGLPTVIDANAPIPIMRQVQMTVGAAILVCTALAAAISPWFLALIGFFGAGLVFAGATGRCGLAAVLAAMPWNRIDHAKASAAAADRARSDAKTCCGGSCGR